MPTRSTFRWMHVSALAMALVSLATVVVAQQAPPAQPAQPRPALPRQELRQERRDARAVDRAQPGQRVTANRPVDGAANVDQQIADCLAIANAEEIALGKLAATKAENARVREFAEKISKDHGQALAQLEKFGAQAMPLAATGRDPAGGRTSRVEGEAAVNPRTPRVEVEAGARGAAVGVQGSGGLNFLDIKRQIAEKCLASAQKEWSEKKMADCEMAFVGAQCVAHQQMLHAQQVLRQHASPELQATIDRQMETTQAHLDHAKQLIESLASGNRDSSKDRSN